MNGAQGSKPQILMDPAPTARQGQFLAFINQYTLVNGCAPAEADMQRYFQITPPSVHSMVLVKDLYEAAAENRDFIQARCQTGGSGGEILEKYRSKIVEQFFPARGEGKLKLGEARKAIRDYRKATGNLPGTAELLMTYVENGAEFTHDYGDIDERFYSSMESALDELAALLRGEAREIYPHFSERLARVEQMTDGIGWGFHDYIGDVVEQLEEELDDR